VSGVGLIGVNDAMSCVFGETAGLVALGLFAALDGELDEPPHAPATSRRASARPT